VGRRSTFFFAALVLVALAAAGVADARKKPQPVRRPAATFASQWNTWWGDVSFRANGATLWSQVPTSPELTHSALITTKRTWRDQTISFTQTTLSQLRTGSAPNVWEVGWVMFRFRDLENYYYFIPKPNGFELGKKHGSDTQIFLATGELPRVAVGQSSKIVVKAEGARIRAWVDGVRIVDFTDPNPLLGQGSVGLYEEDSQVQFTSVTTS
jgi:hypothetical protein